MIFIYSQPLIHPFTDLLRTNTGIAKVMGRRRLIFFQALFSLMLKQYLLLRISLSCAQNVFCCPIRWVISPLDWKTLSLSSRFTTPTALSIGQKFHYKRGQNYQQPSLQVRKWGSWSHKKLQLIRERKELCLFDGECLTNNIIHKATATTYIRSFRSFIHKTLLIIMAEETLLGCSK